MIGSSSSDVSTLPRFPKVKIVDLFLKATRDEKRREIVKKNNERKSWRKQKNKTDGDL